MSWLKNAWGRQRPPALRSLVGEGTVIQGGLSFSDGLRVDGEVHGDVLAEEGRPSLLVVSQKARIHGRIRASHVIVSGQIHGPIHCDGMLELQPGARIVGDVRYERLEMHAGAQVAGELRPLQHAERPSLKLAASNDH
jgi:cytoskeletal protein CcmA (bactofilin family)